MADNDRPQYQHGTGTIGGIPFHWGSGHPGQSWSIPYGDYPVTPNAPVGSWAQSAGAIPIANNVIPDPQLGRNRIGIMIHSGSGDDLDKLYTAGCFRVAQSEWPSVRAEILSEAKSGPLYLHVAPGGVAAFTNTPTFSQAGNETPAANANAAANTAAAPSRVGTATPNTPVNDFYHTAMMHETGGRNIANTSGTSDASGYWQITSPTWAGIRAANPGLNLPQNVGDATQEQQAAGYRWLTGQNVDALTKAGLPVNDKNVFMGSFLGGGGATKFLTAMNQNPSATAADLFPQEAAANRNVFYTNGKPNSLQSVYDSMTKTFGTGNTTGFGPNAVPGTTLNAAGGPTSPTAAPTSPASAPPAASATPAAGTTLPGFQPGSPANKMAQNALKTLGGGGGGGDEPQPPPLQMAQSQAVGGPMMMRPGGMNAVDPRIIAQQALQQQGYMTQPTLAANLPYAPQPVVPSTIQSTIQPMAPGAATGMGSGLPGTTLNSPSQLQMALMSGALSPYDMYARNVGSM